MYRDAFIIKNGGNDLRRRSLLDIQGLVEGWEEFNLASRIFRRIAERLQRER